MEIIIVKNIITCCVLEIYCQAATRMIIYYIFNVW